MENGGSGSTKGFGLGTWIRIGFVLFLGSALFVVGLFMAGILLIVGLIAAAIFSSWATVKLRSTTIKAEAHPEYPMFRYTDRPRVIEADYEVIDEAGTQEPPLKPKRKPSAKTSTPKPRKPKAEPKTNKDKTSKDGA